MTIQTALAELRRQRVLLDIAIDALERLADGTEQPIPEISKARDPFRRRQIINILSEAGKPLTTDEICETLSKISEEEVSQNAVLMALRKTLKVPGTPLIKTAPNTWALVPEKK